MGFWIAKHGFHHERFRVFIQVLIVINDVNLIIRPSLNFESAALDCGEPILNELKFFLRVFDPIFMYLAQLNKRNDHIGCLLTPLPFEFVFGGVDQRRADF